MVTSSSSRPIKLTVRRHRRVRWRHAPVFSAPLPVRFRTSRLARGGVVFGSRADEGRAHCIADFVVHCAYRRIGFGSRDLFAECPRI